MANNQYYDASVAARTRTASEIVHNPSLLELVLAAGGTQEDLEAIIKHGEDAHAYNTLQSTAGASGEHATAELAKAFMKLQGEYSGVMAVIQATVGQLQRTNSALEVVTQLKAILANEVPVTLKEVEIKGVKKRRAVRTRSNESIRAEIEKDAAALLALTGAHAALAARGVTVPRLRALEASAKQLSGKLSARAAKKGAAKAATKEERAAVMAQRQVWGATYRVLQQAAARSEVIRNLLSEAARS